MKQTLLGILFLLPYSVIQAESNPDPTPLDQEIEELSNLVSNKLDKYNSYPTESERYQYARHYQSTPLEDTPTNNDIIIEDVFNQPLVSTDNQPLLQYNHEYNHDHYHSANDHYQKEHKQAVQNHDQQSYQHAGHDHLPHDHYQEYEANDHFQKEPQHFEQVHDHKAHDHQAYEQVLQNAAQLGHEQAEWNAYKTNTRTYFRPTPPSSFQNADAVKEVAEFSDRNDLINEEVIDRAAYHYNRPYYPGPVPPPPLPPVPVPPTPVPVHPVYGYKYQVTAQPVYKGHGPVNYGHKEERNGEKTQGMYYTLLPDGRLQKVVYTVNGDEGYVAHVSYEGAAAHPKPVPIPPPAVYPTGANPGTGRIATPVPHFSVSSQYRELPVHDYLIPPINLGPGPIDSPYPPPPHPTPGPYLHSPHPTNGPYHPPHQANAQYHPHPQSIGAQPIFLPHNGGHDGLNGLQHHGPHGHGGNGGHGGHDGHIVGVNGGGQGPKPGVSQGPVYYEDIPKKEV